MVRVLIETIVRDKPKKQWTTLYRMRHFGAKKTEYKVCDVEDWFIEEIDWKKLTTKQMSCLASWWGSVVDTTEVEGIYICDVIDRFCRSGYKQKILSKNMYISDIKKNEYSNRCEFGYEPAGIDDYTLGEIKRPKTEKNNKFFDCAAYGKHIRETEKYIVTPYGAFKLQYI